MNLKESDTVFMTDGTKGIVLYVYKYEAVAVVDIDEMLITVPISELSKVKPNEN